MTTSSAPSEERIAIVTTAYPTPYETFIENEVAGLVEAGCPLAAVLSLRVVGVELARATDHRPPVLYPARGPRLILPVLRAAVRFPGRFVGLVRYLYRIHRGELWTLRAGTTSFVKALVSLPHLFSLEARLAPDVRMFHGHFACMATTLAMALARWRGGQFSFTLHGGDLLEYPPRNLALRINEARFCVTVSNFNVRALRDRHPEADVAKVRVIRCGIPLERFGKGEGGELHDPVRLLTVARLHPGKGIDTFLAALDSFRQSAPERRFHYTILGDGPQRAALERSIRARGLGSIVTLPGYAPGERIREHLATSDAFVLPSLSEGFPVALMEAAAAGLPLIASRITGIPELLVEERNGLFLEPGDTTQQRQVLERLAREDWALLRRLKREPVALDPLEYDVRHTSRRLHELLRGDRVRLTE